jgi:hypothetical protein
VSALVERIEELSKAATSTTTTSAAAQAMADALADVTARYVRGTIGGRAVVITPDSSKGEAQVLTGGGYGLADGGRHRAVPARAARGHALRTPWGPRAAVNGSTWAGFQITERAAGDVFDAGIEAVMTQVAASNG